MTTHLELHLYIWWCCMATYLKDFEINTITRNGEQIMLQSYFIMPILSRPLGKLSVIDCNVNIIALTTLTHNNSNQTHYYRCTLHPSLFPVVFSHSLSLFQASSPPELRVIGSDISMPASYSTNAAKHKKAQCMDNDAHCCTHTRVGKTRIYTLHNEKGINIQWI